MASQKYKVKSSEDFAEEFRRKGIAFNRALEGLEDRANKCESLKVLENKISGTILDRGDDKYILDWQPYLNDGKRKVSRSLTKLKEIRNHRKQRKTSFIGSVKEALPSWAKKKSRNKTIQLQKLIDETEDYEALITDIVGQISSADDLTNLGNKILQEQDSNLNEQISKDLKVMSTRWNSLCESVINNSNSLEKLGLEVDREYKNLNTWYEKADTFNTWIYFNEKTLDEEKSGSSGATMPAVKKQMEKMEDLTKKVQSRKPTLEEINREADKLLECGRMDQGDLERVERYKQALGTKYSAIENRLLGIKNKLSSSLDQLQKKADGKIKQEKNIEEVSVQPNYKPPPKVITPFHKEDETKSNEQKINDLMEGVKKIVEKSGERGARSEEEKERLHDDSVKAFDSSLITCWKALNDLDEESLQEFSAVGANIQEVKEQLDEIQDLERKMTQEDNNFRLVKETFEESEEKNVMKQESRERLRRKLDDLNSRWEEMWRAHDVNKDRLVQAILIMGGQWMMKVNNDLDDLEGDIKSLKIPADDMKALREEQEKHKEIMNKIRSYEDSVIGAVDVAREVQRRDLVTEETGKTITHETEELEDRLERLKAEAEEKKKRISASLLEVEKATAVKEVMVASSVSVAHSAPDQTSENDEGFVEPKHHFFKKKVTYESLINEKMNDFKKENKSMIDWMDETEKLVNSLSVNMDSKKATRVQDKINIRYGEMKDKQSKVDHVKRLSKQIDNETLDPTISQPFLKEAEALEERWGKFKEMIENYGEKGAESKASSSSCCGAFLKKRLFPIWSYN